MTERGVVDYTQDLYQRLEHHPPKRLLGSAMAALLTVGSWAVATHGEGLTAIEPQAAECTVPCAETGPTTTVELSPEASVPIPSTTALAATTVPPAAEASPATEQVEPHLQAAALLPAEVVDLIDPRTEAAINSMRLSPEGYRNFFGRIDQSYLSYAQQFVEFDPNRVPIEQGPNHYFVWHFTAFYSNHGGISPQKPHGQMDVERLVKGMANTEGPRCCGVNWLIGRDGTVYQLAPLNAKLRHNPPYDSVNTGVEIEAASQADVTPAQYEAAAYLTIAVLHNQGLLANPLSKVAQGHGEMRDRWNAENPDDHYAVRNDFNAPESELIRRRIIAFLEAQPDVLSLTPQLQ